MLRYYCSTYPPCSLYTIEKTVNNKNQIALAQNQCLLLFADKIMPQPHSIRSKRYLTMTAHSVCMMIWNHSCCKLSVGNKCQHHKNQHPLRMYEVENTGLSKTPIQLLNAQKAHIKSRKLLSMWPWRHEHNIKRPFLNK